MRSLVVAICLICFAESRAQDLVVNAKSSTVTFQIRNFGLTVQGSLSGINGKVSLNEKGAVPVSFDLEVPVNSIETGIALRDNHLKKKEYFDASKFPLLKFMSTRVEKKDATHFAVIGMLSVKGVSREIQIPTVMSDSAGNQTFSGSFTIDRLDYQVGGSSLSLADEVEVTFVIVAANDEKLN